MHTIRKAIATLGACLILGACAGTGPQRSTGEVIDDASLTTRVKTNLVRAKGIDSTDISVDTFRGNVMLSGFVKDREQKQRAVDVATATPGVRQVTDNLVPR